MINGPEIISKMEGESKGNLKQYFADAEEYLTSNKPIQSHQTVTKLAVKSKSVSFHSSLYLWMVSNKQIKDYFVDKRKDKIDFQPKSRGRNFSK